MAQDLAARALEESARHRPDAPKFEVTVHVDGFTDFTATVHAESDRKAQSTVMMFYPYKLRGQHASYTVRSAQ